MSEGRVFRVYFSSEHLRGVDLPQDGHTFRITDETQTAMEDGKTVCMLTLRDAESEGVTWVTNITNCEYMTRIFGTDLPEKWVGHLVTLRNDPTVKRGKETVGGIRVIGSPELTESVRFMFAANSRQKPRQVTLQHTGTTKPPASVDPVTGEVGDDDIGFTDDVPHAEEAASSTPVGQNGDATTDGGPYAAEGDSGADGHIPGRGPKSAQGKLA